MKESFKNYIGDLRDVLLALADNLDLEIRKTAGECFGRLMKNYCDEKSSTSVEDLCGKGIHGQQVAAMSMVFAAPHLKDGDDAKFAVSTYKMETKGLAIVDRTRIAGKDKNKICSEETKDMLTLRKLVYDGVAAFYHHQPSKMDKADAEKYLGFALEETKLGVADIMDK